MPLRSSQWIGTPLIIKVLDEPLLLLSRSFFNNEQARQDSRREGLLSERRRGALSK